MTTSQPIPLRRATLLVIDDDNVTRLLLRTQLQKAGFRVIAAEAGEEGLALFDVETPDLVLMDVMMPGLDGFETCRRLRQHPRGEHTPVVMMTGLEDMESIHRAYQAGATDFTTKPINCPVLIQRLRYMLRATDVLNELRRSRHTLENAQKLAQLGYLEIHLEKRQCELSQQLRELKQRSGHPGMSDFDWLCRHMSPDEGISFEEALAGLLGRPQDDSLIWEQPMMMADGSERVYQVHLAAMRDEHDGGWRVLGTTLDITERKQDEQRIRRLAFYDPLTDLPNRILLTEHLSAMVDDARRMQRQLAVITIDLDLFNRVNNTLGQAAGDAVLRQIARRLSACPPFDQYMFDASAMPLEGQSLGARDIVARLAGDTFVAVLTRLDRPAQAEQVARHLGEAISRPLRYGAHELFLSASIGISVYPEAGGEAGTLLRNADMAMHSAKAEGRSNVQMYRPALAEDISNQLGLNNDLRRALEEQAFTLHYQPKVSLRDGAVCGVEALIRWHHPRRGNVPPDQFIRIAEESGLIVDIGQWVLRRACQQLRTWLDAGLPPMRVAVNMAPRQFREPGLVDSVMAILKETGVPASALELEITERSLMEDVDAGNGVIASLRTLGIHIALDDFGTGYSSLSYLTSFPLDSIKIDRCFVQNIAQDGQRAAIVSAVARLSSQLRLSVVAEGIETASEMRLVAELGCDEGQGYHFCRPLPPEELWNWLQHREPQPQVVLAR